MGINKRLSHEIFTLLRSQAWSLSLFVCIFLFHLLFIFQGLDVTDLGFNLSHQILSVGAIDNLDSIAPMTFLTDLVGGLWLSLAGGPSVIWARIGGVLLISINAAIIFSILTKYFDHKKTFIVVIISTIFITSFTSNYINYNTFPALLISIQLWCLNQILNATSVDRRSLYSILAGFMFVPILLSRVTAVPLLISYILATLIVLLLNKQNITEFKKILLPALYGVFLSIIIFAGLYMYKGILGFSITYVYSLVSASVQGNMSNTDINGSHAVANLINTYLNDIKNIIILTALAAIACFCVIFIKNILKIDQKVFEYFLLSITTLGLMVLLIYYIYHGGKIITTSKQSMTFLVIGVITLLFAYILIAIKKVDHRLILLMLFGSIAMLMSPLGSDAGFSNTVYNLWLILPLMILYIGEYPGQKLQSLRSFIKPLLICLLIVSLLMHFAYIYRDDQNRYALTHEFKVPSLSLVFSSSERVDAVDELVEEVQNHTNKGDKVLFVNNIPLFYYLTETKPALGNPWLFVDGLDKIKTEQAKIESNNQLPVIFVYSKVNTRSSDWPNVSETNKISTSDSIKLDYLKDEYVNHLNYSLIWENNAFAMYGQNQSKAMVN